MASAFGYGADTYDTSLAMGELSPAAAVRAADADTLVVADGTSCRHQIKDATSREPLHVARVLAMSLAGQERWTVGSARADSAQVLNSSTASSTPMKPRFALVVAQISALAIEQDAINTDATGGVCWPMARLSVSTSPKWIGSMCTWWIAAARSAR